jgi:probable rRNA maturation factor
VTESTTRSIYLMPWRVDVVVGPEVGSPLPASAIARAVAAALDAASAPRPGSVTVVLTDDEELGDLNREHMGHDGPTDVLSFPMLPPDAFRRDGQGATRPAPGKSAQGQTAAPKSRGPRTHIGDIAVSVERAIDQAEQGRGGHTGDIRWSPADELRLLVTHGTLHLCGWDHAEPREEEEMRELEGRLLSE